MGNHRKNIGNPGKGKPFENHGKMMISPGLIGIS